MRPRAKEVLREVLLLKAVGPDEGALVPALEDILDHLLRNVVFFEVSAKRDLGRAILGYHNYRRS